MLDLPSGIAIGGTGALYIADATTGIARVRLLTPIPPVLSITSTHTGNFLQGQTNAVYTLSVSNTAASSNTSGTVTVIDTLPATFTLGSMSGTGWSCTTNTCTNSGVLSGGASYKPITVTVSVANNAPGSVTNMVSVSGAAPQQPLAAIRPSSAALAISIRTRR
jgi:hypothetical protein